MGTSFTESEVLGPLPVSVPHKLVTAPSARIIGQRGQHARLYMVDVLTAEPGATLTIYDGENDQGTVVATIDGGIQQTLFFGGARCASGIYVKATGSTGAYGVIAEASPPNGGTITLGGTEITDTTRFTGTQGDGRGVNAVTNLFRHGQCDSATDWGGTGGGTTTTAFDVSVEAPYSARSIKASPDGTAANQGVHATSGTGFAGPVGLLGVGSIWFKGVAGAAYQTAMRWTNTDASATEGSATSFNASGQWQLLSPVAVAVAAGKTGDRLGIRVYVNGTRAETFWVANAQLEIGSTVHSYIATSGGNTSTKQVGSLDSSMGIWEASTNLFTNGGVETNTTNLAVFQGTETIVRDTTRSKFGSTSLKTTTPGSVVAEGSRTNSVTAVAGSTYTASCWVLAPVGATFSVSINERDVSDVNIGFTSTSTVGTGAWKYLSATRTFGGTGVLARIVIQTVTSAQAITFWADGFQIENSGIATPYIHTDGATASRGENAPSAPASLINPTQSWFIYRGRWGYPSTQSGNSTLPRSFAWQDGGGTNYIRCLYANSGDTWTSDRSALGVSVGVNSAVQTFAKDDLFTVMCGWTATLIKVGVNGAAQVTAGNTAIPAVSALPSTFAIGDSAPSAGNRAIDGDVFWIACGTGVISDADWAIIHAFGNNDPMPRDFPTAAQCTMVWHANTSTYFTP